MNQSLYSLLGKHPELVELCKIQVDLVKAYEARNKSQEAMIEEYRMTQAETAVVMRKILDAFKEVVEENNKLKHK